MLIKIQKCEERTEAYLRQTKGCGVRLLQLHNLCNLFQPGKSIDNVAIATAREKANTGSELTALSKPFKPVHLLTTALEPAACQRSPQIEVSQAGWPVVCRMLHLPKSYRLVLMVEAEEEEHKWKWKLDSKVPQRCLRCISVEIKGD